MTKLEKLEKLYDDGTMDYNLMAYIPCLGKIFYQGQIAGVVTKKAYASPNYTNKNTLEFNVNLTADQYTNFSSM